MFRPTLGPTQPSVHCVSGLHPPLKGIKKQQREGVSGVDIKNEWSYTSPPAMCLHVAHRGNFTILHLLYHEVCKHLLSFQAQNFTQHLEILSQTCVDLSRKKKLQKTGTLRIT